VTLGDLAKYSMTLIVARCFCDSWTTCCWWNRSRCTAYAC